jgi:glutathione synthase/RimK-type ligase-like ATP-grasp enzyme
MPKTEIFSAANLKNFPYMIKTTYGFGKKDVLPVQSRAELEAAAAKYRPEDLIWQKIINADYEYKVVTVGYQSVPQVLRLPTNKKEFRADMGNAQVFPAESCPQVVQLAELAAKVLGKELAKTDILEAESGLYILEVNRSPGLRSFEFLTGYNTFKDFVLYLKNKLGKAK